MLIKHRNVIIKEGVNLEISTTGLSAEKQAANAPAAGTASSPSAGRQDLEAGAKPLAPPVSV